MAAVLQKPRPAPPAGDRTTFRLYVSSLFENRLGGILGVLVRLFGLDVYGDARLERRGRIEIKAAALMLAMNFLFDLGAWSLLLNAALHSQIRALDGWSVAAGMGGLVLATAVLIYERQFFVADPQKSRFGAALLIRAGVILMSALITAQPVELLFFRGPIDRRVHEEGVRQEAVGLRQKLDRAVKDREQRRQELAGVADSLAGELEGKELTAKQGVLSTVEQGRDRVAVELEKARQEEGAWTGRLGQRRSELAAARGTAATSAADLERLEAQVTETRRRLGEARARRQALAADLAVADANVAGAGHQVNAASSALKQRRDQLEAIKKAEIHQSEADRDRLESWVAQLAKTSPGATEPIVEDRVQGPTAPAQQALPSVLGEQPFSYQYPVYDFFEQLRVLADLRSGRPPLWRGASASMAAALEQQHGLVDVHPCAAKADAAQTPCDPLDWERHEAQRHLFFWSWVAVYGIALTLPALVIAMKFLVARELRDYYVDDIQRGAGHAGA